MPAIFFSRVRRTRDSTRLPPSRAFFAASVELPDRLVEQEGGRDQALLPGCANPLDLAVELGRILRQAAEIGLRVAAFLDRVIGVERARRVDIGADILDHDIRRVAPAADGDVAIGQGETLERGRIGASDNLDAGADREGSADSVDCFGAGEVGLSVLRSAPGRPPSGRSSM